MSMRLPSLTVIEASAGTGKTFSLVTRLLRLMEKKMDGPDNYVIHGSQSDSRAEIVVSRENGEEVEKRWNE